MIGYNPQGPRDVFAMELVTNHRVTLKQLQLALEHSARENLALDVVLLEMAAVSKEAIASAGTAADYVLTAEQPAKFHVPKDRTRSFARHETKLAVQFQDWSDLHVAYTNNLSRGGLGVTLPASAAAPEVESVLSISLGLPNGESMEIKARIVYSRVSGEHRHLGLQFHTNDSSTLLRIDRLLRQKLS